MPVFISRYQAVEIVSQSLELNKLVSFGLCGKIHSLSLYQPSTDFKHLITKINQLAVILYESEPAQSGLFFSLWQEIREILVKERADYVVELNKIWKRRGIQIHQSQENNLDLLMIFSGQTMSQIFSLYKKAVENSDLEIDVETYLQSPDLLDKPEEAFLEIASDINDKKALSLALFYAEQNRHDKSIDAIYCLSHPKLLLKALEYFHEKFWSKTKRLLHEEKI